MYRVEVWLAGLGKGSSKQQVASNVPRPSTPTRRAFARCTARSGRARCRTSVSRNRYSIVQYIGGMAGRCHEIHGAMARHAASPALATLAPPITTVPCPLHRHTHLRALNCFHHLVAYLPGGTHLHTLTPLQSSSSSTCLVTRRPCCALVLA